MPHSTDRDAAAWDQKLDAEKPFLGCPASPHPLDEICSEIRAYHRERSYAMDQRKRSDNGLGSYLRNSLGWHRGLPAAERKGIEARAAAAVTAGEKMAKKPSKATDPVYLEHRAIIDGTIAARTPYNRLEETACDRMVEAVERLPVWSAWAKDVKGLGAITLGTIIGETGNLARYASEAKVWKRMNLAVLDGIRQGGLPKAASKEEWIRHSPSRKRRSTMWVAGDVMVKQKAGSHYRDLYVARKAIEVENAVARGQVVEAASARTKKDPAHFMSKMHVHRRAQRWVEKRLLRDLWRAWRASAHLPETAKGPVPLLADNEAAAILTVSQGHVLDAAVSPPISAGHVSSADKANEPVPAGAEAVPRLSERTRPNVPPRASISAGHGPLADKAKEFMPAGAEAVPRLSERTRPNVPPRTEIAALTPHDYHPSTVYMGDCTVCGLRENEPIHSRPRAPQ